jgi:hypothetical protein
MRYKNVDGQYQDVPGSEKSPAQRIQELESRNEYLETQNAAIIFTLVMNDLM